MLLEFLTVIRSKNLLIASKLKYLSSTKFSNFLVDNTKIVEK